jgi:Tfp pilus assembly protein PilO
MKQIRAYWAVPVVRRGVWVLISAIALIVLTERIYWQPARAAHSALRDEVIALQSNRTQLQTRVDAVPTYIETMAALDVLEARLAAPVDRSGVVERLADVSTAADTQIIHGANSFGRPRGDIRPVLQDLTIEGGYAQITSFLQGLAQVDTMTLLRSAEFSTNADGSAVRLQLKLMTLSAGPIE